MIVVGRAQSCKLMVDLAVVREHCLGPVVKHMGIILGFLDYLFCLRVLLILGELLHEFDFEPVEVA